MSDFDPQDHDHDEDGNCLDDEGNIVSAEQPQTSYPLSAYDLVGIGVSTFGAVLASAATVVHQGMQSAAREFFAAANHNREQAHARATRRLLAEDLASLERGEVG